MSLRALTSDEIRTELSKLKDWQLDNGQITRTFTFKNHYETMAFVNATAWISHREDHHPDLVVGYNRCTVRYSTHDVGGLSQKDFACAAKIEALFEL